MNSSSSIANSELPDGSQPSVGLAIVTGSRGQDGSYLRDLLGYEKSIGCINPRQKLKNGLPTREIAIDLGDKEQVFELLKMTRPSSVFHLAAKHGPSTTMTYAPEDVSDMRRLHVDATQNFLEGIEKLGLDTHLVVAGSSRVFTPTSQVTMVNEQSKPNPTDYYGESKLEAWNLVEKFRNENGSRASFLVLFNHESPRRAQGYFSQDIAKSIQNYLTGASESIHVRDADFLGDWCDARDVVELMAKLSKSPTGHDFVVASGNLRSVRDVVNSTLDEMGHPRGPVLSTSSVPSRNRSYLQAENSKSVEFGIWNPSTKIEQTISEIILGTLKED